MLWIEVFFEKAAPGRNNGKTGKERLISSLFLAFLQALELKAFKADYSVPLSIPRPSGYEISLKRAYYCYAFRYETATEEAAT
ncbi:hypothetical protein [Paenibacillus silagei]|uniref:hypothetical protein n=1 Tax=Paenibacillus TaxID=44249 RepID=UPI001AEB39D1|nr:hypothetical protein [Paenibacillus silagei]